MATVIIKSRDSDNQALVNTDGRLLVDTGGASGGNASVSPVDDPSPGSATQVGGIDPDGNLRPVSVDENGFVNVQGVSQQEGLGAFQTSQYSVGTSAVQLAPTPLVGRSSMSIAIEADPNVPVYIGSSASVTISTGYPLYDGASIQMDLTDSAQVWVVSTTPGQTVAIMEIA